MSQEQFLQETEYCNFSHPSISGVVKRLRIKHPEDEDFAIAAFNFVRDHIKYRVGHWQEKASVTLMTGEGTCTNNANLLVALCRAANIPAGYGKMRVTGDYFGPITPDSLRSYIASESVHFYAFIYLNNRWLKVDPSDDEYFCFNTEKFSPTSQFVTWDGKSDAMLNLDCSHIISDDGPIANIEEVFQKKHRSGKKIPIKTANHYIHFLRYHGHTLNNTAEAVEKFESWLKKEHRINNFFYTLLKRNKK